MRLLVDDEMVFRLETQAPSPMVCGAEDTTHGTWVRYFAIGTAGGISVDAVSLRITRNMNRNKC
jgi:hypothetical protein